jgi:hypothetical protein
VQDAEDLLRTGGASGLQAARVFGACSACHVDLVTGYTAPAPAVEAHTALRDSFFSAAVAIGQHHVDDFPGLQEFIEDKVLFVVGQPAKHAHGWIAYESWRNANDYATEIYINADTRGCESAADLAVGIWTTIAHELAHAANFIAGVQGVSRQGRWHNRKFAEVALALGVSVERHPSLGHVTTGPRAGIVHRYAEEIETIEDALVMAWAPNPMLHRPQPGKKTTETAKGGGAPVGGTSNDGKYVSANCQCVIGGGKRRTIRVALGSWAVGPIRCGTCSTDFVGAAGVSDTETSTGTTAGQGK